MNERFVKFKSEFLNGLTWLLNSKYFPFITAAVTLLCYYLALDIVLIYYICFTGILMLLLLDDVTPIISNLIFMGVVVSYKNSPSTIMDSSDYYLRTEIIVQTITLLSLLAAAAIYRIVLSFIKRDIKPEPVLFGLCAFAAALILNGVFSANYKADNLLYGFVLAFCFLVIYMGLKANIKAGDETFEKVNFCFIALSVLLVIELVVKYFTADGIIVNGEIIRTKLTFGWGMWNTMGMMLLLCIPSAVYFAGKKKYGFVYTLYSVLLFVACFMSCSRQAMVAVVIIYPVCILILLIKGKNRIANICIIAAAVVAGIVLLAVSWNTVAKYFIELFKHLVKDGELTGNGRTDLWRDAVAYFKSSPVFGVGFYVPFKNDPGFAGMSFVPLMCHNTFFQLLSACGIVGLLAYVVHRIQTIISFIKNITLERSFLGLTILGLLITSLFDNHIFYIFPTLIYSSLLAVLIKSQKKINA